MVIVTFVGTEKYKENETFFKLFFSARLQIMKRNWRNNFHKEFEIIVKLGVGDKCFEKHNYTIFTGQ